MAEAGRAPRLPQAQVDAVVGAVAWHRVVVGHGPDDLGTVVSCGTAGLPLSAERPSARSLREQDGLGATSERIGFRNSSGREFQADLRQYQCA